MPKKYKHKLALIVGLTILLVVFFKFSKEFTQIPADNREVSISATPQPTSTTLPIPTHSGKQVRIPILTYHFIGNNPDPKDLARDNLSVAPDKFEDQMKFLSESGYHTITFDTLYAVLGGNASLPEKGVILTFDDGYIDFYINAFPILKKYNLHAVAFIPTGLIGTGYYMNWDQIKEIDAIGLVSFQAHSISHPNLTSLNDEQLNFQLTESKHILEQNLGKPVNTFAYPYGISDERVWQAARQAGYIGAVGTWYDQIISEGVIYDMPRIKISGGLDIAAFSLRL